MIVKYTSLNGDIDEPRDDDAQNIKCDKFKQDRMNARAVKILSHKFVDADYSIWLDANIYTMVGNDTLIEELLGDNDIVLFTHPERTCAYEEINACKRLRRDTDENLEAQREFLLKESFPANKGLYETGVLIRRHNKIIEQFNDAWWAELTRYSCRDQIALPYVLSKFPELKIKIIDKNLRNHKYIVYAPHAKLYR